jgi:hypothetical protein
MSKYSVFFKVNSSAKKSSVFFDIGYGKIYETVISDVLEIGVISMFRDVNGLMYSFFNYQDKNTIYTVSFDPTKMTARLLPPTNKASLGTEFDLCIQNLSVNPTISEMELSFFNKCSNTNDVSAMVALTISSTGLTLDHTDEIEDEKVQVVCHAQGGDLVIWSSESQELKKIKSYRNTAK